VSYFRQLVAGFPPRRHRLDPTSGDVGFVVNKVALGKVFSEYLGFPCQLSFHLSLIIISLTRYPDTSTSNNQVKKQRISNSHCLHEAMFICWMLKFCYVLITSIWFKLAFRFSLQQCSKHFSLRSIFRELRSKGAQTNACVLVKLSSNLNENLNSSTSFRALLQRQISVKSIYGFRVVSGAVWANLTSSPQDCEPY
jgi:hypothetical protein